MLSVWNHEYERAQRDLWVSHGHNLILSSTNRFCLTQKFVDNMNDPDQAEEEWAKTEELRKNEKNAKRLAEEERAKAEESRKNKEDAMKLVLWIRRIFVRMSILIDL